METLASASSRKSVAAPGLVRFSSARSKAVRTRSRTVSNSVRRYVLSRSQRVIWRGLTRLAFSRGQKPRDVVPLEARRRGYYFVGDGGGGDGDRGGWGVPSTHPAIGPFAEGSHFPRPIAPQLTF